MTQAVRARLLRFPPALNSEKSARLDEQRILDAYDIGYNRGLADEHFESRTFATGPEYSAWLVGWRKGQSDLKKLTRQAEINAQEGEKEARGAFERLFREVRRIQVPKKRASGGWRRLRNAS